MVNENPAWEPLDRCFHVFSTFGTLVCLKPIEPLMSSQVKIQETTTWWWQEDSIKHPYSMYLSFLCLTDPPKNVGPVFRWCRLEFSAVLSIWTQWHYPHGEDAMIPSGISWDWSNLATLDLVMPVVVAVASCNDVNMCDMYCCYCFHPIP